MAGAIGAVIVNNMEGGHLMAMGDDGQGNYPHIAAVLVDAAAGQQLSAATQVSLTCTNLIMTVQVQRHMTGTDLRAPEQAL